MVPCRAKQPFAEKEVYNAADTEIHVENVEKEITSSSSIRALWTQQLPGRLNTENPQCGKVSRQGWSRKGVNKEAFNDADLGLGSQDEQNAHDEMGLGTFQSDGRLRASKSG
jgi:hypothetical protein